MSQKSRWTGSALLDWACIKPLPSCCCCHPDARLHPLHTDPPLLCTVHCCGCLRHFTACCVFIVVPVCLSCTCMFSVLLLLTSSFFSPVHSSTSQALISFAAYHNVVWEHHSPSKLSSASSVNLSIASPTKKGLRVPPMSLQPSPDPSVTPAHGHSLDPGSFSQCPVQLSESLTAMHSRHWISSLNLLQHSKRLMNNYKPNISCHSQIKSTWKWQFI